MSWRAGEARATSNRVLRCSKHRDSSMLSRVSIADRLMRLPRMDNRSRPTQFPRCLLRRNTKCQPSAHRYKRASRKINARHNMLSFSSKVSDLRGNLCNTSSIGKGADPRRLSPGLSKSGILSMAWAHRTSSLLQILPSSPIYSECKPKKRRYRVISKSTNNRKSITTECINRPWKCRMETIITSKMRTTSKCRDQTNTRGPCKVRAVWNLWAGSSNSKEVHRETGIRKGSITSRGWCRSRVSRREVKWCRIIQIWDRGAHRCQTKGCVDSSKFSPWDSSRPCKGPRRGSPWSTTWASRWEVDKRITWCAVRNKVHLGLRQEAWLRPKTSGKIRGTCTPSRRMDTTRTSSMAKRGNRWNWSRVLLKVIWTNKGSNKFSGNILTTRRPKREEGLMNNEIILIRYLTRFKTN